MEEAGHDPHAAVVLSGDYGGAIFLTVPVSRLRCDLDTLQTLVSDLDAVSWMSGDLTIATVALERHAVGTGVPGGDGGGLVVDGVWTDPTRLPQGIRDQAAEVCSVYVGVSILPFFDMSVNGRWPARWLGDWLTLPGLSSSLGTLTSASQRFPWSNEAQSRTLFGRPHAGGDRRHPAPGRTHPPAARACVCERTLRGKVGLGRQ